MRAYIIRPVGYGTKTQLLTETVGQGETVEHEGWYVYASKEDAEEMREWTQLANDETIEVVEVTIEGLTAGITGSRSNQ